MFQDIRQKFCRDAYISRQPGAVVDVQVLRIHAQSGEIVFDNPDAFSDRAGLLMKFSAQGQQQLPGHDVIAEFVDEPDDIRQGFGMMHQEGFARHRRRGRPDLPGDAAAKLLPGGLESPISIGLMGQQ